MPMKSGVMAQILWAVLWALACSWPYRRMLASLDMAWAASLAQSVVLSCVEVELARLRLVDQVATRSADVLLCVMGDDVVVVGCSVVVVVTSPRPASNQTPSLTVFADVNRVLDVVVAVGLAVVVCVLADVVLVEVDVADTVLAVVTLEDDADEEVDVVTVVAVL